MNARGERDSAHCTASGPDLLLHLYGESFGDAAEEDIKDAQVVRVESRIPAQVFSLGLKTSSGEDGEVLRWKGGNR